MKTSLVKHALVVATLALCGATQSPAVPKTYELKSIFAYPDSSPEPGFVVQAESRSASVGTRFILNDGQASPWVQLFDVWTDEPTIDTDDVIGTAGNERAFSLGLEFSRPQLNLLVAGSTMADSFSSTPPIQYGLLTWLVPSPDGSHLMDNGRQTIRLGDRSFLFELDEGIFNTVGGTFVPGREHARTVSMRITQESSVPTPVPDEANTLYLLGLAAAACAVLAQMRGRTMADAGRPT